MKLAPKPSVTSLVKGMKPLRTTETPQPAAPTNSKTWLDLPAPIRLQILESVRDDHDPHCKDDQRNRAAYATVSREWQELFEAATFGKLVLDDVDLDPFSKVLERRHKKAGKRPATSGGFSNTVPVEYGYYNMPCIRHIWLRLRLNDPRCMHRGCELDNCKRNTEMFSDGVYKLLGILAEWEQYGLSEAQGKGLTLELSAHTPNEPFDLIEDEPVMNNDYPYLADDAVQKRYIAQFRQDRSNITYVEARVGRVTYLVDTRYLGDRPHMSPRVGTGKMLIRPLGFTEPSAPPEKPRFPFELEKDDLPTEFREFSFPKPQPPPVRAPLPEVKMVTSLLLRRQHHRDLFPKALNRLLSESLTGLREIRHERWRLPVAASERQLTFDAEYGPTKPASPPPPTGGTTLGSKLPSSLESLHLFEDFNKWYHDEPQQKWTDPRPSRIQVLKGVATSAPGIKHLSVAFLSDAMECLDLPPAGVIFPNLESLALTSQHTLRPDQPGLNELLHKAALAALRMPKLQIMEIWNCGNGSAAFFRYEAMGSEAASTCRLTWRCSWASSEWASESSGPFENYVVEAWSQVAARVTDRYLILDVKEPMRAGSYDQYAGILGQLKLRRSILHPTSEMQVRVEVEDEDEDDVPVWKSVTPYQRSDSRST